MTSLSRSNSLESNDDGSNNNNNNNNITNLEDLLNNNTINDDDLPVDDIYEGKVDLEGSITRKLSLDYDEDEDGYFASKVNEAQPGKLPQTGTEKQDEDNANIIKRRKSLHNTNLVLACTRGQLDKVRTMLKHEDADVNFVEEINMFSPLHACVINGHFNVLQILLKEKGANTEIYDRVGWTPIMYAARHNESKCVALLLEHPANVNAITTTGKTALILAAERGHFESCKLLCEYSKTDLYHKDNTFNLNAIEWAKKRNRKNVLNYLLMVFDGTSEQDNAKRGNDAKEFYRGGV